MATAARCLADAQGRPGSGSHSAVRLARGTRPDPAIAYVRRTRDRCGMRRWVWEDDDRDWRRDVHALRDRRIWCGYTQEELAAALHTTRQTISAIETGRSKPNVLLALAIARELDSTVEELFG